MHDDQEVFRALADPTRRALLDALFAADGQTLGELGERFPAMTRFGVSKHLAVLEAANLVSVRRQGRNKHHHLNPVPVAQVARRWIAKYAEPFTTALLDLEQALDPVGGTMTAHVYQIFIRATPAQVWTAITDSDWTERYFHGSRFDQPVAPGPYATHDGTGRALVDGTFEVVEAPADDRPGRLVQSWHIRYDDELGAEPPGRVEWTVSAAGDGLTLVRLVHDGLEASPGTFAHVETGWVWVLDSLKTILETGEPLPRPVS